MFDTDNFFKNYEQNLTSLNEEFTQNDLNNMIIELVDSLGTTTKKIAHFDRSSRHAAFEILADHYLAEIKILVNTKFKPGDRRRIGKAKLEKSRKRLYEVLGYPDSDDDP